MIGTEPIGLLLARLRVAEGKSQMRVAQRLCLESGAPTLTRHEISRWEREVRLPGAFWLPWISKVLMVPLDDLERAVALSRARRSEECGCDKRTVQVRPIAAGEAGYREVTAAVDYYATPPGADTVR